MDTNQLYGIFVSSFDADPNVRIGAELELRKLEPLEGLVPTLLQLISPSPTSSTAVRLAASIYLKNRVATSWRPPNPSSFPSSKASYVPIPPSDRQSLKTNLLPLLAALARDPQGQTVRTQLVAVLGKVVDSDFPDDWPGLVPEISALLTGGEGDVEVGLRATVEIIRSLRYTAKDQSSEVLTSIIVHLFPTLLSLAQSLLATQTSTLESLLLQGSLLHLILKSYKNSITSTLVVALQDQASLVPWGTVFLEVTNRKLDAALLSEMEDDDREKCSWSKSKKWAVYSLNRLFTRFGNPSQLSTSSKALYASFADRFIAQFAPEIMKTYFGLVERRVGGEWIPAKVSGHMLLFFEECIKPKATWQLLKPHVNQLVQHFAFPLVCLTDDEIELFTDDPAEFARGHFGDFIEDSYSNPCATALTFVSALVEARKQATLMPMLNFIQEIVSKYPAQTTAKQKDGALRLLASLAPTATKSKKLAPMMESFFTMFVLPEFKSEHGFLRYRACEVVEKFESCDMDWDKRENLEAMFAAVMGAVTDPELPVRIQAAIALPELVRYDEVRAQMVPNIGRIMQELLKLANEVDLDALTNTTRALVHEFSDEVVPFAVELTRSLLESYNRLVTESLEIREKEEQAGIGGMEGNYDEKTFVCINILKTVDQLVRSLEGSTESLDKVEALVVPALEVTVRNNMVELYEEVFEILDSLTFFQKSISSSMWPMFEATYRAFKTDATDYFHEMFGCVDNFVSFGASTFATNDEYRRMLVDMFDTVMTSRSLGAEDRATACKLAEGMLLNLRGNIDEAVPPIIERCMGFVLSTTTDPDFVVTTSLYLHSLELVVTAIYYNPALSLAILDGHDWTQRFFGAWFKNLVKLTRVHDRKLCIAAICTLIEWLATVENSPLAAHSSQLVMGALLLFKDFPAAMKARSDYEQTFAGLDEEDEDEELVDDGDDDEDLGEEGDVVDPSNDYLDMLARGAIDNEDGGSETGSNWSDEILWSSPLDKIDTYIKFTDMLTAVKTQNPTLFQLAVQPLNPVQRDELSAVAGIASRGGEKSVAPPPSAPAASA